MKLLSSLLLAAFLYLLLPTPALAHLNWCHFWRSCPADNGEYVCGSFGIYTYCPQKAPATPTYTFKTVTESENIPFDYQKIDDPTLLVGEDKLQQAGQPGKKEITYYVTYKNGVEDSRVKTSEVVKTQPTPEVHLIGTKEMVAAAQEKETDTKVPVAVASENNRDPLAALVPTALIGVLLVWYLLKRNRIKTFHFHQIRPGKGLRSSTNRGGFDF
jgi:hypothetical protein